MTDIQMAIGLAQVKKLPTIIKKKTQIFNSYCKLLEGIEQIEIIKPSSKVKPFIPFRVAVLAKEDPDGLMKFLEENEIETRTFFYPLHKQPCYNSPLNDNHFKTSIYVHKHGVCLPTYPALKLAEIKYVCNKIREYYTSV